MFTVFRIEAYIRRCINISMLHLVCRLISKLSNDYITNPQQLRNRASVTECNKGNAAT